MSAISNETLTIMLIVSILAVVMLLISIYISTNLNIQHINDINAQKDIRIKISTIVEKTENGYAKVDFLAIPSINNTDWGQNGVDTFDMYWSILGSNNYSQIRQSLSSSNNGSFTIDVKEGDYVINIVMVYNDKTYEASKTVSF